MIHSKSSKQLLKHTLELQAMHSTLAKEEAEIHLADKRRC
jgi:hypothetical protein